MTVRTIGTGEPFQTPRRGEVQVFLLGAPSTHAAPWVKKAEAALADLDVLIYRPRWVGGSVVAAGEADLWAVAALEACDVVYADLHALQGDCPAHALEFATLMAGMAVGKEKGIALRLGVYQGGVAGLITQYRPQYQHVRPLTTWVSYKEHGALNALRYMVQDRLGQPRTALAGTPREDYS